MGRYQRNSHPEPPQENSEQLNSPSPRWIPFQKIPTYVFKYSDPWFLIFLFINVTVGQV